MASMSVLATKYVRVSGIEAFDEATGDADDPTTTPIQFAFVAPGTTPEDADWYDAEWVGSGTGPHDARILVGPSGSVSTLTAARYDVWWQALGAIEQPVRKAGSLVIT